MGANEYLKGYTTIELTNVHTGEKKIVEDHNTITPFIDNALNSGWCLTSPYPWNTVGFLPYMRDIDIANRIKGLTHGLMMFDKEINETDAYNYKLPGHASCVGYASDVQYTGGVQEFGSFNSTESILSPPAGNQRYVEYVWDFATNQGNGKIKSVCLTTKKGGRIGGGQRSAEGTYYQGRWNGSNIGSWYDVGNFRGRVDRNQDEEAYFVPHPFSNSKGEKAHDYSSYYPWYDVDNDILLIANISNMGQRCNYKRKGGNNRVIDWDTTDYCTGLDHNMIDVAGVTSDLTLWRYHTKPKKWKITDNYYNQHSHYNNNDFTHMFIDKKSFKVPLAVREELIQSNTTAYNDLYYTSKRPIAANQYRCWVAYASQRFFPGKEHIYMVLKPYTEMKARPNGVAELEPHDYIYIWQLPTDISKIEVDENGGAGRIIKIENNTEVSMQLNKYDTNYQGLKDTLFVTDDYLFIKDINNHMWVCSIEDDSEWRQVVNQDGKATTMSWRNSRWFPHKTWYDYHNNVLYIRGATVEGSNDNEDYGTGGWTYIVRPTKTKPDIAVLSKWGNSEDPTSYYGNYTYYSFQNRGLPTYLKTTNKKFLFDYAYIGAQRTDGESNQHDPKFLGFSYVNPILTTINNLPEEVEKTEDYTMKVTYRVTWQE